jgi:hypothetical protein
MSELRIKMKIAEYEFEAEGSNDIVRLELASFKKFLPARPHSASPQETAASTSPETGLFEILRMNGRVISLKSRPESVDDAVLTILAGQKILRRNERVTGGEIMDGLRASGQAVGRIDYLLTRLVADGVVATKGTGRKRRYSLTAAGVLKANASAQRLAAKTTDHAPKSV